MRFAFPGLLILVAIVPLAGLWWTFLRARREKALAKITLNVPKSATSGLQSAAILAGLVLCLFAAARPQWGTTNEVKVVRSRNVVVAVDVSRSMLASDVFPSRLKQVTADVGDLIGELKGDSFALVAFREQGEVVCPLTTDRVHLCRELENLTPESASGFGTSPGEAIRVALDVLGSETDGNNAIILISDGDKSDDGEEQGKALKYARQAKERKIPIFTVGVGNPNQGVVVPNDDGNGAMMFEGKPVKSKLDEQSLKDIAEASGGKYEHLAQAGMLGAMYKRFMRQVAVREQREEQSFSAERYQFFLLPGICCLLIGAALSKGRFHKTK